MTYSMTGFGRVEGENENFQISIDLRAVNHKYFDIQFKAPYFLKFAEDAIKNKIKEYVQRGRVEIYINAEKKTSEKAEIKTDVLLAGKYFQTVSALEEKFDSPFENKLEWILERDGVLQVEYEEIDEEKTQDFLICLLEKALDSLDQMRKSEGRETKKDLLEKLDQIEKKVYQIEKRAPEVYEETKDRLEKRLEEILSPKNIDQNRILQEVCFYADKADINEEIQRIRSHKDQFIDTLNAKGSIGKKLDFIIQEMNREANTMGSKSNDPFLTKNIIEIKSDIEKMREQVQNIQ
ncbi:MAG: YicC/YloC family endoribonuclease [Gallicola sp.]|nr:YicC/YloC family endoribonuclease [Gallicola sp.]